MPTYLSEYDVVKAFTRIIGLQNQTDGSIFIYKSKTNNPKKPDGYYLKDNVRFILDAKKPGQPFIGQIDSYMQYEKSIDENFIGFQYDGNVFKCYVKGKLQLNETQPRDANYYLNKYSFKPSTQSEIVSKISKKLANMFRNAKINKQNNVPFIGAVMLCLKFNKEVINNTTSGILMLIKNGINDVIADTPLTRKQKKEFIKTILEDDTLKSCKPNKLLAIIDEISAIYSFININEKKGHDTMNGFLRIFRKWNSADAQEKGQVFTPDHIAQLMYKLIDCSYPDVIVDPTCGSGTFLTNAMFLMLDKANKKDWLNIKENNFIGIESDGFNATLAGINMMLHGDGASNIFKADCFEKLPELKNCYDKVLMNPPFSQDIPELKFVIESLNNMKPNGLCATILPITVALDKQNAHLRNEILEKHKLVKSVILPANLFYPNAQISTCILIFQAHNKQNISDFALGYDFSDDGYKVKMRIGRENINNDEMTNVFWKQHPKKLNVFNDEWLINKDFDYSNLTQLDFIKTQLDFITVNKDLREEIAKNKGIIKLNLSVSERKLNVDSWKRFKINELNFTLEGKGKDSAKDSEVGNIPLVIAKKNNNGIGKLISTPKRIFNSNKIVVVSQGDGGSGLCFYQKEKFATTSSCFVLSNPNLDENNGLFISTVFSKVLKLRYSHDRHLTIDKFNNEWILLPSTKDGEPNWEWMSSYMNK